MKTKAFLVLGAIALLTAISSFAAYTPYSGKVTIDKDPWEPSPRLSEKLTRACAEGTNDAAFAEVCKEFHVQLAQLSQPVDRPSGYTPNPENEQNCPARSACTPCQHGQQTCRFVNSCSGEPLAGTAYPSACPPPNVDRPNFGVPAVDPRVQQRTPTPIQIQPGRDMRIPGLPGSR